MHDHPEFPIIVKLGGHEAVYRHLQQVSGITTPDALRMWRARGQIPTRQMYQLMRLAEFKGISYQLSDFQLQPQTACNGTPLEPPA